MNYVWMTIFGFGFIFIMTALGAALVFCFRKEISNKWNAIFFGFASGIMLSAAIWSLLLPAMKQTTPKLGKFSALPISASFLLGCAFLLFLDRFIAFVRVDKEKSNGIPCKDSVKNRKIFLAVTLHNIPEGLAVGFAFGAARSINIPAAYAAAMMLSIGIGVQNFPEGAAISLPLSASKSRMRAFLYGVFSGLPEPIFAIFGYFLSTQIAVLQPWLLSFSAGAMFFVVADELLPSTKQEQIANSSIGGVAAVVGFAVMMVLDIILG